MPGPLARAGTPARSAPTGQLPDAHRHRFACTVVEGPPEKVWPLLQAVHQVTLESGADRSLSIIKVSSGREAGGPSVADLVRKFRAAR